MPSYPDIIYDTGVFVCPCICTHSLMTFAEIYHEQMHFRNCATGYGVYLQMPWYKYGRFSIWSSLLPSPLFESAGLQELWQKSPSIYSQPYPGMTILMHFKQNWTSVEPSYSNEHLQLRKGLHKCPPPPPRHYPWMKPYGKCSFCFSNGCWMNGSPWQECNWRGDWFTWNDQYCQQLGCKTQLIFLFSSFDCEQRRGRSEGKLPQGADLAWSLSFFFFFYFLFRTF